MRFILLSLVFLAFVGCGTDGGSAPLPITQPAPVAASAIQVSQVGDISLYAPQTIVVGNSMTITVKQPAKGWMPQWNVVGGTLNGIDSVNGVFMQTVTPTADPCIVTITWYESTTPPPPPPVWN